MMYKGRFAPSPTGALHFGSLLAALASYLDARSNNGEWHIRIDDVDQTRCKAEYSDAILSTLESIGFEWDGPLVYQSKNNEQYEAALLSLRNNNEYYFCSCTRKELQGESYPGYCRNKKLPEGENLALRLLVNDTCMEMFDHIQGTYKQNLGEDVGDFIIRRKDGLFAYHLATVIDDANSGFTHIVRGVDLLESTPRQIFLQQKLNLFTPEYYHIPIVTDKKGSKLSKQNHAEAINSHNAANVLYRALTLLKQNPPPELASTPSKMILQWAQQNWKLSAIGNQHNIIMPEQVSNVFHRPAWQPWHR